MYHRPARLYSTAKWKIRHKIIFMDQFLLHILHLAGLSLLVRKGGVQHYLNLVYDAPRRSWSTKG
jgi:hypothetical protein